MADPKVVRGTLGGVAVTTTEETAALLGAAFEPEAKKAPAKKAAAKSESK